LTNNAAFNEPEAIHLTAAALGISAGQVAKLLKKARILVNRQN
jgi:hypothetical protein